MNGASADIADRAICTVVVLSGKQNIMPEVKAYKYKLRPHARFVNQFTSGYGNYTEERPEMFENLTMDEMVAEIEKSRKR